jgi:redox-sensitive bicupin YhaK (pirin superfamily)
MTAGTGVRHSEGNDQDKPLRFIQSWIVPRSRGLKPNYGSSSGEKVNAVNQWSHLAGDIMNKSITCPIKLNQDVNMHIIKISPNTTGGDFSIGAGRQAYLLCVEGSAVMNGAFSPLSLNQHDGSEIYSGTNIAFTAGSAGVHLLLFEMAFDKSGGRKDL